MAESQARGLYYESIRIKEETGLNKDEYNKQYGISYTSPYDMPKGCASDVNKSFKTADKNTVYFGDVLRMMSHKEDVTHIIGRWNQETRKSKRFHTEYEVVIKPEDYSLLWGTLTYEEVEEYVNYVKAIPHGEEGQEQGKLVWDPWVTRLRKKRGLFQINTKVDSDDQRRVQCSMLITNKKWGIKESVLELKERKIDYLYSSPSATPRKRNKK